MLGERPGTEGPLVLGRQVRLVGRCTDERERVGEVDDRDLVGHHRQRRAGAGDRSLLGRGRLDHAGEHVPQHRQHLAVVADEAELDVERAVLREVPNGVVRLGAEHRADLVDPLEDADQLLLVELRALGEVRRPPEPVDREHVRPRLGRRAHHLGGGDLGEAESVERRAETAQRRGGELPARTLGRVAPQDRGVVEQRGEGDVERGAPELGRRRLGRLGEGLEDGVGHLHAAGCLLVRGRRAGDPDRRLLRWHGGAGGQDDLGEPAAVAQDHEGDARQLAPAVHPPLERDGGAGRGTRQVGAERSRWGGHGSSRV